MSLIHEYGDRKEQKGIKIGTEQGFERGIEQGKGKIILDLLNSGMSAEEISQRIKMPLEEILEIKNYSLSK